MKVLILVNKRQIKANTINQLILISAEILYYELRFCSLV